MELAVGAILEGKVTGITKFGAFVALPGGKTGMVHISEIAHAYVSDIAQHLQIGQEVKVMVIAMEGTKINLSIKRTQEAPARQPGRDNRDRRPGSASRGGPRSSGGGNGPRSSGPRSSGPKEPQTFDDMLKQFMADSDSKISSIKQYSDHRTKNKRRQ